MKPNRIVDFVSRCCVKPGKRVLLANHDPAWAGDDRLPLKDRKRAAERLLSDDVETLIKSQELLYASDTWSVLVIFQAMDAAGKDGTIKHVMSGLNPQGCQVFSFKHPSAEELDHNFLWRYAKALPERGRIGIFNRSYYEEVLVVRVHPELLAAERVPISLPERAKKRDTVWRERFEDIDGNDLRSARH